MNSARRWRDNAPARFVWRFARLDKFPAKRPPAPAWQPWRRRIAAAAPARQRCPARSRISRAPRPLQSAARHFPESAAAATATGARPQDRGSFVSSGFMFSFIGSMGGGVLPAAHKLPFLLSRAIRQMSHITSPMQPPRTGNPACSCARCIAATAFGCAGHVFGAGNGGIHVVVRAGDGLDLIARSARRNGRPCWRRRCSRRSPCRKPAGSDCPRRAAKAWASLAVALMVIAANAAAPRRMRRLRVFILILLSPGWRFIAPPGCCICHTPASRKSLKNPQTSPLSDTATCLFYSEGYL